MTGLGNAILVGCKWSEWFEFFIFFNPIPLHLIELDWLDLIGLNWVDYQIKSLKKYHLFILSLRKKLKKFLNSKIIRIFFYFT